MPLTSYADIRNVQVSSKEFVPTEGLRGKVEFWVRIFTKYGPDQLVFHYRDHPEVVYSVLDFSDYKKVYDGRTLVRMKKRAEAEELSRIDAALAWLGQGGSPRNEFENRIRRIFEGALGKGNEKYRRAREADQIRSQTGIRERFADGVKRSGRYLYALEQIFAEEGLPREITRLPLVESSFDYTAYSSVGAAGIWQFMPGTAKHYMRVSSTIDERRDPIIATRAAARYIANAHRNLRRWPLAITSYNHGVTGVLRAVKAAGSSELDVVIARYNSPSFGFASKNFFASFLAALEVERNAKNYFPGLVREEPWHFDEVRLLRPTYFRDLVKHCSVGSEELQRYNLALLKPISQNRTAIPAGYVVKVPRGEGLKVASRLSGGEAFQSLQHSNDHFRQAMSEKKKEMPNSPEKSSESASHQLQTGENLGTVARKYNVSVAQLMAINKIKDPRKLRTGTRLRLPTTGRQAKELATTATHATASTEDSGKRLQPTKVASENSIRHYIVVPGDTLTRIAKKANLSLAALKERNPSIGSNLRPGQKLRLE